MPLNFDPYKEMIFPPWTHQEREFHLYKDERARSLHWQMRTGKTKAMVDLACYRYEKGEIDGVIILAPNNVHRNWITREIPQHHWMTSPFSTIHWDSSEARKAVYDTKMLNTFGRKDGLVWYSINVEASILKKQLAYLQHFVKTKRFMLIIDEVHEWRRISSKRSKMIRSRLRDRAVLIRTLSGTMIDNNPLHAFPQYELLAKGALGYDTLKVFEQRYGIWEQDDIYVGGRPRTIPKLVGFQNQDELREKMAKWTSYVYRDECDDLPDLVEKPHEFELTPEQRRVYNDLVKGSLIALDNGEELDVDPDTGVITKLQNIRSGFLRDQDGDVHWIVEPDKNPAFIAVDQMLKAAGKDEKFIVWCRYVPEIEMLRDWLKKGGHGGVVDYYGGTKPKDRDKHERRFREDPKTRIMIAQPKACGQGLDFSAGSNIIWFSHIHGDLIARRQADERCTKMGGRKISVTDMIGANTVDDKILADQDKKVALTDFLTGEGLREFLRTV